MLDAETARADGRVRGGELGCHGVADVPGQRNGLRDPSNPPGLTETQQGLPDKASTIKDIVLNFKVSIQLPQMDRERLTKTGLVFAIPTEGFHE
jgi:hypothetical protein